MLKPMIRSSLQDASCITLTRHERMVTFVTMTAHSTVGSGDEDHDGTTVIVD